MIHNENDNDKNIDVQVRSTTHAKLTMDESELRQLSAALRAMTAEPPRGFCARLLDEISIAHNSHFE